MCGSSGARRVRTGASCSCRAVFDAFATGAPVEGEATAGEAGAPEPCAPRRWVPWCAWPPDGPEVRSNSEFSSLMRREMESMCRGWVRRESWALRRVRRGRRGGGSGDSYRTKTHDVM